MRLVQAGPYPVLYFRAPPSTAISRRKPPGSARQKARKSPALDLANTGAAFYKGRCSSVAAISGNIYGPYAHWHEAVPCGGGGDYFRDKDGNWWCTLFGNDDQAGFREKPAIVRIEFDSGGLIHVAKNQPDFVLNR